MDDFMEPKLLCRTCLEDTGEFVEVFSTPGCDLQLPKMLKMHLKLEEDFSQKCMYICHKCINCLAEFHKMFQVVQSTQEYFSGRLQEECILHSKEVISYADQKEELAYKEDPAEEEIIEEMPEVEVTQDVEETTDIGDITDLELADPVTVEPSKSVKLGRKAKITDTVQQKKDKSPRTIGENYGRRLRAERRTQENEVISTAIKMTCCECKAQFCTFEDLVAHCRQDHAKDGFVTCCDKKFKSRPKLLDHIKLHLDPNAFTCTVCHKKFANNRFMKKHMESHVPENEREFSCEKCQKRFATKFRLSIHMNSHNEDYSFKCHLCDKTFNQKIVLYSHVRYVHESFRTHICEVCAKVFKTKQAFLAHKAAHEETLQPRLTCEFCGNNYKNKYSLNFHLLSHTKANERHYCNICNKEFNSKRRVTMHQKYVHAKTKLKCLECDKEFKRPIYLKEHMALHTGENLYTCKFCPKEFKSNANKYAHQKAQHPEKWEEEKRKKKES